MTSYANFIPNFEDLPVTGSPLTPPHFFLYYFLVFLFILGASFLFFSRTLKHLAILGVTINIFLVSIISAIGLAYLLPSPKIIETKIPSPNSPLIEIVFDHPVSRRYLEKNISPDLPGVWLFQDPVYATHLYRRLVYYPSSELTPQTTYTITLTGIQNTLNTSRPYTNAFSFTTPSIQNTKITLTTVPKVSTTKINAPAYLQQHSLSCEVSSLRMALAYYGIKISEDTLLSQLGVDPTPHNGNIWGDPNQAFVGNVNGKQMVNGYGVYWDPIARIANLHRSAKAFTNWNIQSLTQELKQNHPVLIWVYSSRGTPTSWKTPAGKEIYAVRDQHTVLAVGFVGSADNPTQMIINDPLYGQVYWSRATFDKKWAIFSNSAVVVY